MYRGTTPTITFTIPFSVDDIVSCWITISQNRQVIIDKPIEECELNGSTIRTTLTQEETLRLGVSDKTEIQLRLRLAAQDTTLASRIYTLTTERILKEGVI